MVVNGWMVQDVVATKYLIYLWLHGRIDAKEALAAMESIQQAPPTHLLAKLVEIMKAVPYIQKTGENKFHGYRYATEADIKDRIQAALIEHGVVFVPQFYEPESVAVVTTKAGKEQRVTQVRMVYTFWDAQTGESITSQVYGHGIDGEDKGLYKAVTGAIKYALSSTFLFATGDDPEVDGNYDREDPPQRQASAKPQPVTTQPKANGAPRQAATDDRKVVAGDLHEDDPMIAKARADFKALAGKFSITDASIPSLAQLRACVAAMCGAESLNELDGKSICEKVATLSGMTPVKLAEFVNRKAPAPAAEQQPEQSPDLKAANVGLVVKLGKKMKGFKLLYRYLEDEFGTKKADAIEDQDALAETLAHLNELSTADLNEFLKNETPLEENSEAAA